MKIDGEKLNYYRERKLLSVREMCKACSISTGTWWRASNDYPLNLSTVRRLCEVLDVSLEDLEKKEGGE